MRRLENQRGNAIEYVVLATLAGLCALFVLGRYGGSLRGKVEDAQGRVEDLASAAGRAKSGGAVVTGRAVLGPERTGQLETRGEDRPAGVEVLGFRIGIRTAISLAMLVVVLGVWMVARVSRSVKKDEAAEKRS